MIINNKYNNDGRRSSKHHVFVYIHNIYIFQMEIVKIRLCVHRTYLPMSVNVNFTITVSLWKNLLRYPTIYQFITYNSDPPAGCDIRPDF